MGGRKARPCFSLARIMHETPWRDRGDGRATGQTQGLGPEAYLSVRRKVSLSWACRRKTRGRPEGRPYPRSQRVVRA